MSSLDQSYVKNSAWKPNLFENKVVFITGGAGTIGKVQSQALVLLGASVSIIGRNKQKTESTAAELSKLIPPGSSAKVIGIGEVDVRNMATLTAAVERTVKELGKIDYVIAGAAGNFLANFANLSSNAFRTVVEIDLIGSYNTAKATYDQVKANKGAYVFISAGLHYAGTPLQTHAAAAKAGVDALSNNLAIELGPLGIRSNVISPGAIEGTEGMDRLAPTSEIAKKTLQYIPLQRMGTPRDIADGTVFLLSPAASYVSGTTLVVDAGLWRMGNIANDMYPDELTKMNSGKNKL